MKTEEECRRLDAWIAEHVMGVVNIREVDHLDNFQPDSPRCILVGHWPNRSHRDDYEEIPRYSTDPAANRDLELKLADSGNSICIIKRGREWNAYLNGRRATAPTLELAICLLAKKIYEQRNDV